MPIRLLCIAITFILYGTSAYAQTVPNELIAPQPAKSAELAASDIHVAKRLSAARYLIAAGRPEAADAGARIMEAGGNALDAAIAAQMALNVVEPQASGVGGGAFLLYYDAAQKKLYHYDGRETAPAAITPLHFTDENGNNMPFFTALEGGRSVGVPGLVAMLGKAHKRHGSAPWASLFDDAVHLAEQGMPLSMYVYELAEQAPHFLRSAASDPFKESDGSLLNAGDIVRQPMLARTLRDIAVDGADSFYKGSSADAIVRAVTNNPIAPGLLTETDLLQYKAKERLPICVGYRGYKVCGAYPPSSGGITVLQALKLLEPYDLAAAGGFSADIVHLIGSALRLAFADRNTYIGDPDMLDIPVKALLSADYIAERHALLGRRALPVAPPGNPEGQTHAFLTPENPAEEPVSTTHISVRDAAGNVASMTSSIEYMFGSAVAANGFLLNNQLTDFAFDPVDSEGGKVANAAAPGKRPRSSMAPFIVFDANDNPVWVTGSPGGARIIPYVLQNLIAGLDFKMSPEDAAYVPRISAIRPDSAEIELEENGYPTEIITALEARGWNVITRPLTSGVHTLAFDGAIWHGAADPRRDGAVAGK